MRILAIKTHATGDLLLTTPALRALRRGFGNADLTLLTGRANVEVARCLPGISAVIFVDEYALLQRKPAALYNLYKNVKRAGADRVVSFHAAAKLNRIISWAKAPLFAPFADETPRRYLAGGARWRPMADKYIAQNYVEVAAAAGGVADGLHLDFVIPDDVPKAREITGLKGRKKYVAVAPGGGLNPREAVVAKVPPESLFVELIDLITAETGRPVVLLGGPGDVERCAAVAAKARRQIVNLAGRTSVAEAGRVIAGAAYLVTVDSLPMHLAVALGKSTLGLFTASKAAALLPPGGPVTAVAAQLECAPCYANSPFPRCRRPFKYECRERIPFALIKEFILKKEKS